MAWFARCAQMVDDFSPGKIFLVVRSDNVVVCFRHGGYDGVKSASRIPFVSSIDYELGSDESGFFVGRQDAPGEQDLGNLGPKKPRIQVAAPLVGGLLQDAATDFRSRLRRGEEILVSLFRDPRGQGARRD